MKTQRIIFLERRVNMPVCIRNNTAQNMWQRRERERENNFWTVFFFKKHWRYSVHTVGVHWFHRSPQRSGKAVQKLHNVTPQQTGFPPASPMHATRREHARWSGNVKHNCYSLCQWQLLSRFRKSFVVAFGGSPSLCMASFGLQSIVRGCVVFLHGSGTPSPSSPPLLFLTFFLPQGDNGVGFRNWIEHLSPNV